MIILTICAIGLFGGLLFGAIKLSLRVAWGLTKAIACALCVIAFPLLIVIVLTAGGFVILLPVLLVAGACGLLGASA